MATEVTLAIPDFILDQAQEDADATHKPLEQVLIEALAESYPLIPAHPQREKMLQEVNAYESLHTELVENYLGNYVAIHQGQVVDNDSDSEEIIIRIGERYPDEAILIRKVQKTLPPEIRIRSPRLIREH